MRNKWVRHGSFGCLGVLLLLLLTGAVVSVAAFLTARPAQLEERVLSPRVPASAGRFILDTRDAEVRVVAAEPGEPLRVQAHYDVNAFMLEEEFDPGPGRDGTWTYRVTFGKGDLPGAFSGLVSAVRGTTSRVDVYLPADVRLDLDLGMTEGGAVVRLGGLWLRHVDVRFERGALDLSVDEPLREPVESLSVSSRMGGALLNKLGNASPRRLDVGYRMGGIDMDLSGRWARDAEITIDGGMGGGVVHLPLDVTFEGLGRERGSLPTDSGSGLPTLSFDVDTGFGALEFSGHGMEMVQLLD